MKTTKQDRVEELIRDNKAFSCSDLYIHVGTMLANSKEISDAQKHVIKTKDKEKQNKHNIANELTQVKKDNAIHSYKLLKYENYKMKLPNWSILQCGYYLSMVKRSHQSTIHWRVSKRGWINAKYAGSHIVKETLQKLTME